MHRIPGPIAGPIRCGNPSEMLRAQPTGHRVPRGELARSALTPCFSASFPSWTSWVRVRSPALLQNSSLQRSTRTPPVPQPEFFFMGHSLGTTTRSFRPRRPIRVPGEPTVSVLRRLPNTPGIRRPSFAVEDIDGVVARLRARSAELVGALERDEDIYGLCYVRGPAGILIEPAERIG